MPRHKTEDYSREIGVDPIYNSELVQKLINVIMEKGKKNTARRIVYDALDILSKKAGDRDKGLMLFQRAFNQVIPAVEVRPRRVGGSVYQIPVEVHKKRAQSLALRWITGSAQSRSNKTMGERLGYELLEASEGRGNAVKKKIDTHKMAESNRAFAHFAW
ncbi:30S ribosomal protein S7 [candidate division TM6 bacterium RIFCSPHIGHO2_12_FULL_32_22]|nr:MAG: 30S ribosomal protein S7 [candidate division TM6 bacterium RIFCSPHIGHO2_12_FULL_32_22]